MRQNLVFSLVVAFALGVVVYPGCSSDGDGGDGGGGEGGDGGDAPTAMSFNGETSVPATGGASLATSYSNGLSSVISSMLTAIAADASSESASKSLKFLDDLELGICTTGGTAVLDAPGAGGSGGSGGSDGSGGIHFDLGDAFLTFTNCAGSPLSSTAINGTIELKGTTMDLFIGGSGGSGGVPDQPLATAEMSAVAEIAALRIAPSTVLAGEFAVAADIVLSSLLPPEVESIDQILGDREIPGDHRRPDEDLITVDEDGRRALEFGCFQVVTGIRTDPPAIDPFQPRGVLLLEGRVYTLNRFVADTNYTVPTIGFDLSGVTAVPVSGYLELYSGDQPDCDLWGASIDGDTSKVTATFRRAETVPVVDIRAEDPDGSIYECTEEWENLLQTLRDIAFDSCPCVENCGTGGTGGSGTGGSGGSVGVEYCASYTLFSHACDVAPTFGEAVLVNIDGSAMTYTMNAGPFSNDTFASAFDVSATGTWDGTTGAGTGEFVEDPNWPRLHPQGCAAPQARLTFDLTFASALAEFSGPISFDVMLDADCGSSLCFASATVTGTRGPCP
jgi:hypothetical protein